MSENRCVSCGEIIPEGMQVCQNCLVNKPPHYKTHKMECINEMMTVFGAEAVFNFCRCNAWKYRYRADSKGTSELDQEKADWYIETARNIRTKYGITI